MSDEPQNVQTPGKNFGGVPKIPTQTLISVTTELLAASQNVSHVPEIYGQSRAERRLRKFKPKMVAELLRRKSLRSYESGDDGWTAM
jgi:hypothetical protein